MFWEAFVCVILRVMLTVAGDGKGDGNSRTVSRFMPTLFLGRQTTQPHLTNHLSAHRIANESKQYNQILMKQSIQKGALFIFHRSAAQGPCDRRTMKLEWFCCENQQFRAY